MPWASLVCFGQPDVLELACQEAVWRAWAQSGLPGPSLACLGQPDVLELACQEAVWCA